MKVEGAAALVTGANRGLGAAIAQALLDSGAKVYGAARDTTSITNRDVIPVRLDVTSADDIADAARTCGDVSIVVNNAGILRSSASLAPGAVDAARAEMETNFFGSMRMARAFAPVLRDNGGGALVNVLSVLSFISMPQGATYSASKAAAWSLTNALRIELRRQGTLVVAVHAGFIDTDMAAGVSEREDQPAIGREADRRGHRSRRRGGPRRSHQRDGEGGAAQRPDGAVPRPAGTVGRRSDQPMSIVASDPTMKAFIIDRYKPSDGGRIADVPEPVPADGQVLVQIHAAGVNLLDSKIRSGEFKFILPYRMPLILGNDVAGEVVRVGPGVRRFNVGDEVYARPDKGAIGTFAELIAMNEADVARKPRSLSMEEAASIPLVGLTAWQALVERANLQHGQKVFIQAGSGGVGTFAIQLAKHLGATVATTTSAANVELVEGLGADIVIDYKTQDFEAILDNYDVVLHSQDGTTLDKSLRVLKPGGRLISISGPPDPAFGDDIGAPWFVKPILRAGSSTTRRRAKRLEVDYSFLFMRANGTQLTEITSLIDAGIIRPILDRVFSFASTNEAIAYVESGRAKGKVVVTMR